MLQLLSIVGTILLYLFIYYEAGSLILRLFPSGHFRISRTLILGFFAYHFLFWICTIPLKIMLQPLSLLSAVWAGVIVIITILFIITEWKNVSARRAELCEFAWNGKEKYITLLFLVIVLVQVLCFNYNAETYAIWDQSYYLGDSATSLYTNTISQYDGYTGRILEFLAPEYLLETYQNHDAVMCQLLHLHPMIENLTIMASVVIILYFMVFYEIGLVLFQNNRAKTVLFTGFLSLLNFYSFNLYTAAEFLIIRPSEGKTILAVLIVPVILWMFLCTLNDPERTSYWWYSAILILGSFGLNMSSIFMIPFETSALYLPLALKKRSWRIFLRYLLLMVPCVIVAALYLLTKHKFIIYTGK